MIDRNELHAMKTAARFDEFGNTRFPTMAKRAVELGLEPADSIKSEGMSCFAEQISVLHTQATKLFSEALSARISIRCRNMTLQWWVSHMTAERQTAQAQDLVLPA